MSFTKGIILDDSVDINDFKKEIVNLSTNILMLVVCLKEKD